MLKFCVCDSTPYSCSFVPPLRDHYDWAHDGGGYGLERSLCAGTEWKDKGASET